MSGPRRQRRDRAPLPEEEKGKTKMGSVATPLLINQFILFPAAATKTVWNSKLGGSFNKMCRSTGNGILSFSFAGGNHIVGGNFAIKSKIKTSATTVVNITSSDTSEDHVKREVEQLLDPEERAKLQQNVTPNLEKISTEKWSPLHTLALSMQMSCMDKLLENGFDIDFINKDGLTALHKAIIGKKEAVISHLLRKGASPHVKDKDGATPLHYAVQVGAKQTVKLLIKYNVDVNVADHEGWTPLHIAVQGRNRDIVKILLVNGADKTRKTKDGKTALDLCLCYGKDFKSYEIAQVVKLVPADSAL
ncbi:hypothetical protein PIB30_038855 [Stylosanthes scabra]|uniref:Uncharacterized protein n=1 Tax=Stylosanthes scabra TaxID=79078 RepID=A0ABU6VH04_9FABA|nr:hypothetical protein [Stylosanthes scabra]